jgi:hypothetical protein
MKKIFCLLFVILLSITVKSQVLTVDSIEVSRVITHIEKISGEHEGNGPLVNFFITIKNNADSIIVLHPAKSNIEIKYQYRGQNYAIKINPLSLIPFVKKDSLLIKKGEEIKFDFSTRIFLGTKILDLKRRRIYNYAEETMQVLPTLQVIYRENNQILISRGINSVKLFNYNYTYQSTPTLHLAVHKHQ